jgi:hypothetical protein
MENPTNPEDALEPMFHGMPVLVRLTNREDILCMLFQSRNEDESRLFMERPLRIIMDEIIPDKPPQPVGQTKTVYSTVRTRFDRWIPFTTALIFPIYPEHILSIAPLADAYINSYMEWSDQLYEQASPLSSAHPDITEHMHDETPESIKQSYIDYLLHNFKHKGKPH